MIDMESEIFDEVSHELREQFPEIYFTGEIVNAPPQFPCASLVEINNVTYRKTRTTETIEHHSELTYEVQVFSNKHSGKKKECREIANCIDEILCRLGFSRNMLNPISNLADDSIYRIVGRYKVIVDNQTHILHRR